MPLVVPTIIHCFSFLYIRYMILCKLGLWFGILQIRFVCTTTAVYIKHKKCWCFICGVVREIGVADRLRNYEWYSWHKHSHNIIDHQAKGLIQFSQSTLGRLYNQTEQHTFTLAKFKSSAEATLAKPQYQLQFVVNHYCPVCCTHFSQLIQPQKKKPRPSARLFLSHMDELLEV